MLNWWKQRKARKLMASGAPRRIKVHSVHPVPSGSLDPDFYRIAFEFLDPPGPWSMQFYEVARRHEQLVKELEPGRAARFLESDDGARTRVLLLEDGRPVWPR